MGDSWREPRPKSTERLSIVSIENAEVIDGRALVSIVIEYDTWCCSDMHEVFDAVSAIQESFKVSSEAAYKERMAGAEGEFKEIREQIDRENAEIKPLELRDWKRDDL